MSPGAPIDSRSRRLLRNAVVRELLGVVYHGDNPSDDLIQQIPAWVQKSDAYTEALADLYILARDQKLPGDAIFRSETRRKSRRTETNAFPRERNAAVSDPSEDDGLQAVRIEPEISGRRPRTALALYFSEVDRTARHDSDMTERLSRDLREAKRSLRDAAIHFSLVHEDIIALRSALGSGEILPNHVFAFGTASDSVSRLSFGLATLGVINRVLSSSRVEEAGLRGRGQLFSINHARIEEAKREIERSVGSFLFTGTILGFWADEISATRADSVEEKQRKNEILDLWERHEYSRKHMIDRNLRLVISVARRFMGRGLDLDDLIQEGNIGLMYAVERFDPDRGTHFSTFATWQIRAAITRAIADMSRTVRIPVHAHDSLIRLRKEMARLSHSIMDVPDAQEVAEKVGISPEKARFLFKVAKTAVSLDAPMSDDEKEGARFGEFIEDVSLESPDEHAIKANISLLVDRALKSLPERNADFIRLYFGIGNGSGERTLREIGGMEALSYERIRQVIAGSIKRLSRNRRLKALYFTPFSFRPQGRQGRIRASGLPM